MTPIWSLENVRISYCVSRVFEWNREKRKQCGLHCVHKASIVSSEAEIISCPKTSSGLETSVEHRYSIYKEDQWGATWTVFAPMQPVWLLKATSLKTPPSLPTTFTTYNIPDRHASTCTVQQCDRNVKGQICLPLLLTLFSSQHPL